MFTRLARNLDWMGLDDCLPHVIGCTSIIFQSAEQWPHPSHFIAMTGDLTEFCPEHRPADCVRVSDQQEMLRAILEYHGAKEILWVETDHLLPSPTAAYQFARAKLTHRWYADQLDGTESYIGRLLQM